MDSEKDIATNYRNWRCLLYGTSLFLSSTHGMHLLFVSNPNGILDTVINHALCALLRKQDVLCSSYKIKGNFTGPIDDAVGRMWKRSPFLITRKAYQRRSM